MSFAIEGDCYRFENGRALQLETLSEADAYFLRWLDARVARGDSYYALLPAVQGPGAYVTETRSSRGRVTAADATFDLMRRAAARDGIVLPKATGEHAEGFLSVTEAATRLDISRAAVVKAIRQGRMVAYRMG